MSSLNVVKLTELNDLGWHNVEHQPFADHLTNEDFRMSEIPMGGQMLWKLEGNNRVLHLRHTDAEPWRHYEEFPQYFLPDPLGFSKGLATFIALRKKDWTATVA